MEILVIVLIIILIALALLVWVTVSLLGLIVTLAVAAGVGWLADQIVPGDLPYGWLGAIAAGLLGSFLGGAVLGDVGPEIADISLLPALVGAIVFAAIAEVLWNRAGR